MTENTDNLTAEEVALVAFQGLLSGGVPPDAAGSIAWMVCVPGFFHGMSQYVSFANRVQNDVAFSEPQKEYTGDDLLGD